VAIGFWSWKWVGRDTFLGRVQITLKMLSSATRIMPRNILNFVRSYSEAVGPSATAGHEGGMRRWRLLTYFVALPGVAVCMVNAYLGELEHKKHAHRPEFKPYDHLRIRNKRYPWGDGVKSFFHNPAINALPDGYEDEQ